MLKSLYSKAQFAFIGGSLFKENGGHNIIEAASENCPFVIGPYMYNFHDVLELFSKNNACLQVSKDLNVLDAFKDLLNNQTLRENMSANALEICIKNQGSIDKQCMGILEKLNKEVIT